MNTEEICPAHWESAEPRPSRHRLAASTLFLVDGIGFGTWAALIPSVKQRFALTEASLSMVLLAIVIGALISMSLIGRILSRHGTRAALIWLAPVYPLALAFLGLSASHVWLMISAVLFGAAKGSLDVAINAQAISVERAGAKPIMASFQALWSFGGLLAALLVGLAVKQGLSPWIITSGISAALLIAALASTGHLIGGDASPRAGKQPFRFPSRRMWQIGALAFIALFAEGVMMDWSAVYTLSVSEAPVWLAPLAYGVFSLSMALGRLTGDHLISRHGGPLILRMGGVLTVAGLLLITSLHQWPVTFLGLALAGAGLANMVPVLFGAAGRAHEGGVGQGIATVSMIGYFGFLSGPPLIGGVSHLVGLPAAFVLVGILCLSLVFWGSAVLNAATKS